MGLWSESMRRVSLDSLTSDMVLAKSIYDNGNLILSAGVRNLSDYVERLLGYEIYSVYVEDAISDGIHIPDALREETRKKCKDILDNCFHVLVNQGGLQDSALDEMVVAIMNDLLENPEVIVSMSDIGTKDDDTLIHSINTAVYAVLTGKHMGYNEHQLKELAKGALFHDLGKILISSEILLKNGKLTNDEFEDMKEHTVLGYETLCDRSNMSETAKIISLQHHERLDGSGYPKGLRGDEIHPFAKIVAIADVYDALTAERCYRRSMSNYSAYSILKKDAGIKFDAKIFEVFMQNIAIYPNGAIVQLSDGTHGIVKQQNKDLKFRPIVRVIDDRDKQNIQLYDLNLKTSDIEIID